MAAGTSATSPRRWVHAATFHLFSRSDAVWYFVAVVSVLSLLTHELSRSSVLATTSDFEGFDFDEEEEDSAKTEPFVSYTPPPPPSTQSFTPESHHGPPDPSDLKSSSQSSPAPVASVSEEWDEDEFEGIPFQSHDQTPDLAAETPHFSPVAQPMTKVRPKSFPGSYPMEVAFAAFLICFAVNFFTGRKENEDIALSWAAAFATKNTVFERNFSLLGTGSGHDAPLLLKEGQDVFKFYASGRRHCQSLLATLELKSRHDLISRVVDSLMSKKETITFEVVMNEDAMDHVVFALARKKLAKAMYREESDLQKFAGLVLNAPSGRKWVPEELLVVSESKEVAGDMLTDVALDQVFGEKAFEKVGKWFISMHFSDQRHGSQKKVLTFKFALPDRSSMDNITRLMALVPYYIDFVGRYKLSQQARSKTEAARAKAAQEANRELLNARQEQIQKRKAEKKKLAEDGSAKLGSEALRKKEEKDRARQMKKAMPKPKILRSK